MSTLLATCAERPEMAVAVKYGSKHHVALSRSAPDRCLRRWTGTAGVTHHRCNFLTEYVRLLRPRERHHRASRQAPPQPRVHAFRAPGRFTGVAAILASAASVRGQVPTRYSTVVCTLCPAREHQEHDNQQKCKKCAHGRFGATAGLATCTDCAWQIPKWYGRHRLPLAAQRGPSLLQWAR